MLRIVERLMGHGRVVAGAASLADVGYTLSVYQEWTAVGTEMTPGAFVVEGHLLADPEVLDGLLGRSDLVLHLDDDRRLAFHLASLDGAIAGADERGFVDSGDGGS
ncbi:MAG: hypothetical protein U0Q12_21375 [Vicinamibacterales bacterium]